MILRFNQDYHITLKIGGINRQILFILPGNEVNNLSMILYLKIESKYTINISVFTSLN